MAKLRRGLPTPIAASLGRIIARWAFQEHLLSILTYNALGVTIKQGRIAVRENLSPSYRMALVADLLALRRIAIDRKEIAKLGDRIEDAKNRRDQLAHSAWVNKDGEIGIQDTTGQWDLSGVPHTIGGRIQVRVTRKMNPGFLKIDKPYLDQLRKDIEANIYQTNFINSAILEALRTLREIQPGQLLVATPQPHRARKRKTPPTPPSPSQG